MSIKGHSNVFGGIDVNGTPFVMVSYEDTHGSHQFLMPPGVARQLAHAIVDQAGAADELAKRFAVEVPMPEGPPS